MEKKTFKKGELVHVFHIVDGKWIRNLGIILKTKSTLQIAKVYVQGTGRYLKRVPYRFIEHTNNKV